MLECLLLYMAQLGNPYRADGVGKLQQQAEAPSGSLIAQLPDTAQHSTQPEADAGPVSNPSFLMSEDAGGLGAAAAGAGQVKIEELSDEQIAAARKRRMEERWACP